MTHRYGIAAAVVLCTVYFLFSPEYASADAMQNRIAASAIVLENPPTDFVPGMIALKLRVKPARAGSDLRTGLPTIDLRLAELGVIEAKSLANPRVLFKGTQTKEEESLSRLLIVRYGANLSPADVAKAFAADPNVEYAEPVPVFFPDKITNDPRLSEQWALDMMNIQEAWDVTEGDSTMVIGIVDTGVDWTHEDLAANIYRNPGEWGVSGELSNNNQDDDGNGFIDDWHGWDFLGNGDWVNWKPDNDPMEMQLHGTSVASCVAAVNNNAIGLASPAGKSKILPVKVGADAISWMYAGYHGIVYAADMGCKVINCSWGRFAFLSRAQQDIIDYALSKGALVVASSGNDGKDTDVFPHTPSAHDKVLSVGAMTEQGQVASFSNYGTSVHTFAPGQFVLVASKGNNYEELSGTSFSGPYTAGIAALVRARHPEWTPLQVAQQIHVTSDPIPGYTAAKYYGLINAFRAVSANQTLSEIPGLRAQSFTADTVRFPGQTVHVTVVLENLLAPTSAAATAHLEFDNDQLSAQQLAFPLGEMPTFGTKTLTFTVRFTDRPDYSEAYLPVRLRIEDGQYIDYTMGRVFLALEGGWRTRLVPAPYRIFTSISPVDTNVAWTASLIGRSLQSSAFRSTDGGENWADATGTDFPVGSNIYYIKGIDSLRAIIGGSPVGSAAGIYRTVDGGATWAQTQVTDINGFVNGIVMYDSLNGVLLSSPKNRVWQIGKTSDGGATWTAMEDRPTSESGEIGWVHGFDAVGDTIWFTSNKGLIYRSTDKGATWASFSLPEVNGVSISFRDGRTGLARFAHRNNTGMDWAAVTTDGGETWTNLEYPRVRGLGMIVMERYGTRAWSIDSSRISMTPDLGKTWEPVLIPQWMTDANTASIFADGINTVVWAGGSHVYNQKSQFGGTLSAEALPTPNAFAIIGLYPNPVSGSGSVTLALRGVSSEHISYSLIDVLGRTVRTGSYAALPGTSHVSINTAGLSAGSYTVAARNGHARAATRVVVR